MLAQMKFPTMTILRTPALGRIDIVYSKLIKVIFRMGTAR